MAAQEKKRIRDTTSDRIFNIVIHTILIIFLILVIYPVYFVLIASVSDPTYVNSGDFLLYPKGFTLLGYQRVFQDDRIWVGYGNTLIYTVLGTILGILANILAGYALSRHDLPGRNIVMALFVFTMYFGGGMIPFYIIINNMNMVNTRALMVILGSVSVYNIIIVRSFFVSTIPLELQEAAFIDGCTNQRFFISIVLPLSKAIVAVIALYTAVGYWNSYFNALIFLTDTSKFPLQLYLREILLTAKTADASNITDPAAARKLETMVEVVKYGVIVVSTLPILCVYPFIQKYFVKGVMIGAIKG
ncbi:MAG: carbohydrate ABC transporter permease [Provencibacterium sp.]|jgi:putative aldouronate transport system permease protein|nr:carbohydrate ABC transporter permease [Provencibacterium sp.]